MEEAAIMYDFYAWCDGACEPRNPGGWGIAAYVLETWDGKPVRREAINMGRHSWMTSNRCEYHAVQALLDVAIGLRAKSLVRGDAKSRISVLLRTDSMLVVKQITGEWNCNAEHLIEARNACRERLKELSKSGVEVDLEWVPREENTKADTLSKSLYDEETLAAMRLREASKRR